MEQRLTMVTLGVKDLERSVRFYTRILGWQLMDWESDNIALFQLNGILLSLFPEAELAKDANTVIEDSEFKKFTLAYCTRNRTEVDTIFTNLRANKVQIVKDPEEVFWGGYSGYFADPDSHLWEVAYNPFLKLDQKGDFESTSHL